MKKTSLKRSLSLLLALATLLALFAVPAYAATGETYTRVKVTSKPTTVDTFQGVPAKYIPGTNNSNTGTYCCAQYVHNFYQQKYKVTISNLKTGKTPVATGSKTTYKVKQVSTPKVGDIYYQKNSSGSGHWAIVKKVTKVSSGVYKVQLIEQNWKWSSSGTTYAAKNRTIQTNTYGKTYGVKFFRVYNSKGTSVN
jgi:hypothetical protein